MGWRRRRGGKEGRRQRWLKFRGGHPLVALLTQPWLLPCWHLESTLQLLSFLSTESLRNTCLPFCTLSAQHLFPMLLLDPKEHQKSEEGKAVHSILTALHEEPERDWAQASTFPWRKKLLFQSASYLVRATEEQLGTRSASSTCLGIFWFGRFKTQSL